ESGIGFHATAGTTSAKRTPRDMQHVTKVRGRDLHRPAGSRTSDSKSNTMTEGKRGNIRGNRSSADLSLLQGFGNQKRLVIENDPVFPSTKCNTEIDSLRAEHGRPDEYRFVRAD